MAVMLSLPPLRLAIWTSRSAAVWADGACCMTRAIWSSGHHVGQAVGAEQQDVAGAEGVLGHVGGDGRLDADGAGDDVAEAGALGALLGDDARAHLLGDVGVVVGQPLQRAVAQQVGAAVPGMGDAQGLALDDGGDAGGAHALVRFVLAAQFVDAGVGLPQGGGEGLAGVHAVGASRRQHLHQRLLDGLHGDGGGLLAEVAPAHAVGDHQHAVRAQPVAAHVHDGQLVFIVGPPSGVGFRANHDVHDLAVSIARFGAKRQHSEKAPADGQVCRGDDGRVRVTTFPSSGLGA